MTWELTMATMLTITGAAAVFVAWPLLVGRTRPEEFFDSGPREPVLQQLMLQRDTTYAAMKELEFDLAMGNLSREDFQQLQERYKRKAVAILKRIDDTRAGRLHVEPLPEDEDGFDEEPLSEDEEGFGEERHPHPPRRRPAAPASIDLDVEQEIEAYRKRSGEQAGRGVAHHGQPAGSRSPAGVLSCPSCGRPVKDAEAAFCSRCGAPIRGRGDRPAPRKGSGRRTRKSNGVKGD